MNSYVIVFALKQRLWVLIRTAIYFEQNKTIGVNIIFFLFFHYNIDCGYSLEPHTEQGILSDIMNIEHTHNVNNRKSLSFFVPSLNLIKIIIWKAQGVPQ